MQLSDGEPGDYFLTGDNVQWAIWKILDGDDLATARELGYKYPKVAACVLVGREDQLPVRPQFDPDDWHLPYAMTNPADPMLQVAWTYLGKL